jgi:hypothetical protein
MNLQHFNQQKELRHASYGALSLNDHPPDRAHHRRAAAGRRARRQRAAPHAAWGHALPADAAAHRALQRHGAAPERDADLRPPPRHCARRAPRVLAAALLK